MDHHYSVTRLNLTPFNSKKSSRTCKRANPSIPILYQPSKCPLKLYPSSWPKRVYQVNELKAKSSPCYPRTHACPKHHQSFLKRSVWSFVNLKICRSTYKRQTFFVTLKISRNIQVKRIYLRLIRRAISLSANFYRTITLRKSQACIFY